MLKSDKLFLNNLFFYYLGLIFNGFVSFVTIPLVIKYYGIESYGAFSLLQNVIFLLMSFGGGWLTHCVVRFNDFSTNFKYTIYQLFLVVILPTCFLNLFIFLMMDIEVLLALICTTIIFLGSLTGVSIAFLQSKLNAQKASIFDFLRTFFFLIMILTGSFFMIHINGIKILMCSLFLSFGLSFLVIFSGDFRFYKRSLMYFLRNVNGNALMPFCKEYIYLFNYGWPLSLWFVVSSVLNVSDRYIISFYLTDVDVGIYSAVYDLLNKSIALIFTPILIAGMPFLLRHYKASESKELVNLFKNILIVEISVFIFLFLSLYLHRGFIIEKVLGIVLNSETIDLVLPLISGSFVWQLAMLAQKPLEFQTKTKTMLVLVLISLCFSVTLNFLFIPIYGLVFAAYSTLISSLVYLGLNLIYSIKFFKRIFFMSTEPFV